MKKVKLTERQTVAILEMRLRQLAALERMRIDTELKEKKQLIKNLAILLKSQKNMERIQWWPFSRKPSKAPYLKQVCHVDPIIFLTTKPLNIEIFGTKDYVQRYFESAVSLLKSSL